MRRIHFAVQSGDVDAVRELLEIEPSEANKPDENGHLPLWYVAALKHPRFLQIAQLLIAAGANVNYCGGGRIIPITPIHMAAMMGNTPMVELLLANGAKPNPKHASGLTPRRQMEELVGRIESSNPEAGRQIRLVIRLLRQAERRRLTWKILVLLVVGGIVTTAALYLIGLDVWLEWTRRLIEWLR